MQILSILLSTSALVAAQVPIGTPGTVPSGAAAMPGPPRGLNAMNQTSKYMGTPTGTPPNGSPPTGTGRPQGRGPRFSGMMVSDMPSRPTDAPPQQFSGPPMMATEMDRPPAAMQTAEPSAELVRAVAKLLQDVAAESAANAVGNKKRAVAATSSISGAEVIDTMPTTTAFTLDGLEPVPVLVADASPSVAAVKYVNTVSKAATGAASPKNATVPIHYPPPIKSNGTMTSMPSSPSSGTPAAEIYQNMNMAPSAQLAPEINATNALSIVKQTSETNTTATQNKKSTGSSTTSNARALSALGSGLCLVSVVAMMF